MIQVYCKKIFIEVQLFTMLCQFLLYSKANQPYIYIYSASFFEFPSHLGHCRALSRVPCANSRFLLVIYFIHSTIKYVHPYLTVHPISSSALGIYMLSPYICVSISAQQIGSSVPFPRFHIYTLILEKAMATHCSTLAWKIPWTEEPSGLQSMGSLRVRHN